jgi:raffinose/stachyose/melibiose transport system substrate-binding protein
MTARPSLHWLGLIALTVAFALSSGRLAWRWLATKAEGEQVTVVRIAHWQLESGMREAFADAAAAYQRIHPSVRIQQVVVPERHYQTWTTTQLVGGTGPDIMQYRFSDPALLARFFIPLSRSLDQINPYNEGSSLAGQPWRETFADGLTNPISRCEPLGEVFGIPFTTVTVRIFYNVPLFERLTGRRSPPATLDEFFAAAEQIRERSNLEGRPIAPLAGSLFTANMLVTHLFNSQMQGLANSPDGPASMIYRGSDQALALLNGRLKLREEPMFSGFGIMEAAINALPSGFAQSAREDAAYQFSQGRAAMILAGSFDDASLRQESAFEVAVFPLPMPSPGAGRFGRLPLGPLPESTTRVGGVFGVNRQSPHPEVAIDFLRFLSSYEGSLRFTSISRWPPIVRNVIMPSEIRVFAPVVEGYPAGFDLGALQGLPDTQRVLLQHSLVALQGPGGGLEAYLQQVERDLPRALRSDLERHQRRTGQTISWMDTVIAATRRIDQEHADLLECTAFSMERDFAWTGVALRSP